MTTGILLKNIAKVENNIKKIILNSLVTTNSSIIFWSRLQADLRKEYNSARKLFINWSSEDITLFYSKIVAKELKKVNLSKAYTGPKISIKTFLNKDITKQSIDSLIKEANAAYLSGLSAGEKDMLRFMSYNQQINATEFVGDFIKEQQKLLAEKAISGKYIKIIDKNGKTVYYNLKSYTDLITRTKLTEASTLGVIDTSSVANTDLIQVSSHNTLTPFDAQFEGKIYSLSGKDTDFPQATFLPPFHPRCLHNITIIFKQTLERRGLQKYIDFSKGITEQHPTRKGHIPVSERRIA